MNETSWYLADIDISRHVVPYTYRQGDEVRSPTFDPSHWVGVARGRANTQSTPPWGT